MNNSLITFAEEAEKQKKIKIKQQLNYPQVRINRKWIECNMAQLCPLIKSWKTIKILAGENENKNIIKQIAHIQFSNLTTLSLFQNNIESIQGLSRIYFPAISDWISLRSNHIYRLSDIRKCYWPLIKGINICNNHISDANCLTQMHFPQQIQFLTIQHNGDRIVFLDIRFVMKLKPSKIQTLCICIQNLVIMSPQRKEKFYYRKVMKQKCAQIKSYR